jgi:hypothetical protein
VAPLLSFYRAMKFYQQSRFFFQSYNVGKCSLIRKVGKVSPDRYTVPDHIDKPPYYENALKPDPINFIEIKNLEQIKGMRSACKLAANLLKKCGSILKVS